MRPLSAVLVVFALCLGTLLWYRDHARAQRDAARAVVQAQPPVSVRSLEERAAAAQGTTLPPQAAPPGATTSDFEQSERADSAAVPAQYACDGRTRCPQMHSCEEATWFLQHCPGTKMDGDGDGTPCEIQFCGN
jgi:hypothetical protein